MSEVDHPLNLSAPAPFSSALSSGTSILVIDDDESLRDTIGVMIEQEGFRAILAGDGRSGFDKALTLKPDLARAHLRLATVLMATGDREGAAAQFRDAASGNDPGIARQAAQALREMGIR